MKKKLPKHTFFCESCKSPCTIYKKGKKHRVLVCPNCGVVATNGKFSLKRVGKGASVGAAVGSVVPGVGTAVGGAVGGAAGLVSGVFGKKKKSEEGEIRTRRIDSGLPSRSERIINKELYGE